MANTMTAKELIQAMEGHNYMLVRYYSGEAIALNTRILHSEKVKKDIERFNDTKVSAIIRPIGFHEYISRKIPFMRSS